MCGPYRWIRTPCSSAASNALPAMWSRRSMTSTRAPCTEARRSAMTAPAKPAPTTRTSGADTWLYRQLGPRAQQQRTDFPGTRGGQGVALTGGDDRALHEDVPLARERVGVLDAGGESELDQEIADPREMLDAG